MKTFTRLFLVAAAFGAVVGVAYFFTAKEEAAGTTLLAFMTAALVFSAGYAILAERDADLPGDEPRGEPSGAAGEDLGVFTTRSAWPILCAACGALIVPGALWTPLLGAVALVATILCLWRMGAESART